MEYELEHSDTLDDVVGDYLMHYGVSVDDGAPGPGSGRYPKGSGERPYQHDENKDAGEKKKGLFGIFEKLKEKKSPYQQFYETISDDNLMKIAREARAKEEARKKAEEEAAKKDKEEKVEYDTDRPQLMKEIDSPEWHDKSSVEKIKSIEKEWLNTDGDYIKYAHDPEYRKSIQAVADLGLKAVDKLRGPGYVDFDEGINDNLREWFFFEDQTIGMPAVANFINKGYSAKQVKYIIDEIEKANDDPATKDIFWNNRCTFQVWEGNYDNELKTFAQYCEDIKLGTKGVKHSDDLFDDFLAHYGVGPDDNPPGRGSGRYAKGTGENPYQHDDAKRAQMKKRGLFGSIQTALAKRKANTEIDRYRDYVDGMLNGSLKNNKALHEKYKELNERTDGKEFERGPFRYQYNVPDELSGKETDREKLAAEWKKFSEEVVDKHAKAEARNTRLEKARETKAANKAKAEEEKKTKEEREAEKAKAIASGDPEQISKWLSEMSNQEQFDALNRIRQTKDIKSQAAAQVKAREDAAKAEEARRKAEEEAKRPKTKKELRDEKLKESFETAKDIMNTVDDVRQMAEKGIKFWNVIAAVNNASNPDFKLPKVDLNPGEKKKDKDKEENKEKDKNKNQQNNSGSSTNTNSNNTTYNTTNNYYNGEKKEETKSESEAEAETWRPSGMEDWYDAPYKYEEAGKLLLEDFMKRKK